MDYKDFVNTERAKMRERRSLVEGGWVAPPKWLYDLGCEIKEEREAKEAESEPEEIEIRDGAGGSTTFTYFPRVTAARGGIKYPTPTATTWDRDKAMVFPGVGTMRKFEADTRGSFQFPCGGMGTTCRQAHGFSLMTTVYHDTGLAFFNLMHGSSVRVWTTDSPSAEQLVFAVQEICDDSQGKCIPFWQE